MTLTDMQSPDVQDATIEVMFNPRELKRKIAPNYARQEVLGNTHAEHEYLSTGNQDIDFDLFYNVESIDDLQQSINAMNFLESLVYAPEDPESLVEAAPPRVLLVWPNTLSMTTRLMSVEFNHQRFNRFGYTIQWTAKCTWEETRVTRLNKADVRAFGSLRAEASAILVQATERGELVQLFGGEGDADVSINPDGDTEIDFGSGGEVIGGVGI